MIGSVGGFVEVNGVVYAYGFNGFQLLVAIFGVIAFATRKSSWALAYSVLLGLVAMTAVAVMVYCVVVITTVGTVGCSSLNDSDASNTCGLFVGTALTIIAVVLGIASCIWLMCLGCGISYYKGLKRIETGTTYVILPGGQQQQQQQGGYPQQQYSQQQYVQQPVQYAQQPVQYAHAQYQPPQMSIAPPSEVPGVFKQ